MSKRLTRYVDEIRKTEEKIEKLQEHLRAMKAAQKEDENRAIIRSIRSMNLKDLDLVKFLEEIQEKNPGQEQLQESVTESETDTESDTETDIETDTNTAENCMNTKTWYEREGD